MLGMGSPGGGFVVGIEIEDEGTPVGGVDVAEVFYAVGQVDAAGGIGTFGEAFTVATVVLLGVIVPGESILDGIDAVGGTRGEVG